MGSPFTRYVLAPGRLTCLGNNAIPCTYSGLHLHVFLPSLTFSPSTTTTTFSFHLHSCPDNSANAEQMDAPHATITILDVSLSLVHIPRSRVADLNRPILKQLLRRSPKFLNLTANELELSIFVENDALGEFEVVARKDRQKLRCRELAATGAASRRRRREAKLNLTLQPVEISLDKWRVLQIDSHEDALSKFHYVCITVGHHQ